MAHRLDQVEKYLEESDKQQFHAILEVIKLSLEETERKLAQPQQDTFQSAIRTMMDFFAKDIMYRKAEIDFYKKVVTPKIKARMVINPQADPKLERSRIRELKEGELERLLPWIISLPKEIIKINETAIKFFQAELRLLKQVSTWEEATFLLPFKQLNPLVMSSFRELVRLKARKDMRPIDPTEEMVFLFKIKGFGGPQYYTWLGLDSIIGNFYRECEATIIAHIDAIIAITDHTDPTLNPKLKNCLAVLGQQSAQLILLNQTAENPCRKTVEAIANYIDEAKMKSTAKSTSFFDDAPEDTTALQQLVEKLNAFLEIVEQTQQQYKSHGTKRGGCTLQ